MDLLRREGESEIDYHKRLVFGKLVDKTLADADYSEIAECIYGKQYASDVARRMLYGSRNTLELYEKEKYENLKHSDVTNDIDTKILELNKERKRLQDQRREYNKNIAFDGRFDNLLESLKASAEELNSTVGSVFNNVYSDVNSDYTEAVIAFSDWHYGMVAKNAFNEFDTEICKKRVEKVISSAINRIQLHGCSTAHIVVLGDLFHGAIHTSARVASEELVCDQLMQVSEILAQAILKISEYVGDVKVYMTYGNHARTVQNKNDSIHRDNIERIIPWWLEQRFSVNPNIQIVNDRQDEFIVVQTCGVNIVASHGDLDSVKSSPTLLSTLFQKKYGIDIDYVLLGDKHHSESFSTMGINSIICGALCGSDDYANEHRLFSDPEQLMLIVNPIDGVDAEYKLKCN